jgi:hypothetical protein
MFVQSSTYMIIERNCNHSCHTAKTFTKPSMDSSSSQREWLVDHSMYIHFHKLKVGIQQTKPTNIEDAPSDIKSLWLL